MGGIQLMQNYQNPKFYLQTKTLVEKLRLGKFSLSDIAKVTGISEQWLQKYFLENDHFVAD